MSEQEPIRRQVIAVEGGSVDRPGSVVEVLECGHEHRVTDFDQPYTRWRRCRHCEALRERGSR